MKLVDFKKIIRMDELILRESTGTPLEFAEKLEFSRTTFFSYLSYLREELGADIKYDAYRETYYYEDKNALSIFSNHHCDLCKKKIEADCLNKNK